MEAPVLRSVTGAADMAASESSRRTACGAQRQLSCLLWGLLLPLKSVDPASMVLVDAEPQNLHTLCH